jgi:hypothetical protein
MRVSRVFGSPTHNQTPKLISNEKADFLGSAFTFFVHVYEIETGRAVSAAPAPDFLPALGSLSHLRA